MARRIGEYSGSYEVDYKYILLVLSSQLSEGAASEDPLRATPGFPRAQQATIIEIPN